MNSKYIFFISSLKRT